MNDATARPWEVQQTSAGPNIVAAGNHIAALYPSIENEAADVANAALIVKAVNRDAAFDALVAALEEIQVQTQDPAIERLCAAVLPEAQR